MNYKPIACELYDQLELLAIRQQPVKITLQTGEEIELTIKTLETRPSNEEFLIASTGQALRLDQIKLLNGKPF